MFFVIPNRESLVTNGIECLFCWNIPTRWVLCVSSKSKGTLHHPAFSAVAACVGQAAPSRGENKCGWKFEWTTSTTLSWYFSDIAKYININIHNQTIIYNNMSMYMMYKYIYIYTSYIEYSTSYLIIIHVPVTSISASTCLAMLGPWLSGCMLNRLDGGLGPFPRWSGHQWNIVKSSISAWNLLQNPPGRIWFSFWNQAFCSNIIMTCEDEWIMTPLHGEVMTSNSINIAI